MQKEVILIDKGEFQGVIIGYLNGIETKKEQIEKIKKAANIVIKKGCYHFRYYEEPDKEELMELEGWSDYLFSIIFDKRLMKFSKSWTVKYFCVDKINSDSEAIKDLNEIERDKKKEAARIRIASKWGNQPLTTEEIQTWRTEHSEGLGITKIARNHNRRYATVYDYVKGINREKN